MALFNAAALIASIAVALMANAALQFSAEVRAVLPGFAPAPEAQAVLTTLLAAADGFDRRMIDTAILAALCAGPIHVFLLRNAIRRLRLVTKVMNGLTRGTTHEAALEALRRIEKSNRSDEISDMVQAVEVFRATTESLKESRDELRAVNARFEVALNNMARGLSMFDIRERLVVCNASYRTMYDLPEHLTRPGTELAKLLEWRALAAPGDAAVPTIISRYRAAVAKRTPLRYTRNLDDGRVIDVTLEPLVDGGWVTVHQDVTRERRAEAKIAELARQDPLTALANRRGLEEALEKVEHRGSGTRSGDTDKKGAYALLCIDLDHFKAVNDTYGHPTGDALLVRVAELLKQATRSEDLCARIGGDEFAVVQSDVRGAADTEALARRIIEVLTVPIQAGAHLVTIGASIGVAIADGTSKSPTQLMGEADVALYWSKSNGRNTYHVYGADVEAPLRARRQLTADMRPALQDQQFSLNFQPIITLAGGTVSACEALVRWKHPVRGFVSPAEFIPLAEQNGFIHELGAWVIDEACRVASGWPDSVSVAVNLSAVQLQASGLFDTISSALIRHRFAPQRFEIEVTESALIADIDATRDLLSRLKSLGIRIALDDFGTGYSSLSYLRAFPFDKLKIDQSFVRDISNRDDCVAIVKAVAGLAASLDMPTVAEGVETHDHLHRVNLAGCTAGTGLSVLAGPCPTADVPGLFATWRLAFGRISIKKGIIKIQSPAKPATGVANALAH